MIQFHIILCLEISFQNVDLNVWELIKISWHRNSYSAFTLIKKYEKTALLLPEIKTEGREEGCIATKSKISSSPPVTDQHITKVTSLNFAVNFELFLTYTYGEKLYEVRKQTKLEKQVWA